MHGERVKFGQVNIQKNIYCIYCIRKEVGRSFLIALRAHHTPRIPARELLRGKLT